MQKIIDLQCFSSTLKLPTTQYNLKQDVRGHSASNVLTFGITMNYDSLKEIPLPWPMGVKLRPEHILQLFGRRGCGKTQVAVLCAKKVKGDVYWVCPGSSLSERVTDLFPTCIRNTDLGVAIEKLRAFLQGASIKPGLIIVEDLSDYNGRGTFALSMEIDRCLNKLKQIGILHQVPIIITCSVKESNLAQVHPKNVMSRLQVDSQVELSVDTNDSWELVDEAGEHLGRRISAKVRGLEDASIVTEAWIDFKSGAVYDRTELERKLFD